MLTGVTLTFHGDWCNIDVNAAWCNIDVHADWCKNCHAMDNTTFRDPAIVQRLEELMLIKYAAEQPSDPATKAVMDYYEVRGLPTYVLLAPK